MWKTVKLMKEIKDPINKTVLGSLSENLTIAKMSVLSNSLYRVIQSN